MKEKHTTLESIESKQINGIPSNIWETDCKYCIFRDSEENFKYRSRPNRHERPCRLEKYSGNCGIWDSESGELKTEHEVRKEHCGSVRPCEGFGICATCHYQNSFAEDTEYCTHNEGPLNRRNTMPWVHAGYGKEVSSFDYSYFTCDRYRVNCRSWGIGEEELIKRALEGRIPMNFNPETMQPLEYMDGEPIAEWKQRQQAHEAEKPENVKKRKLQDAIRQRMKKTEVADDEAERRSC